MDALCFDVGGTVVKTAAVNLETLEIGRRSSFPANSAAGADEILSAFRSRLAGAGKVAMAWPGPFDYEKGVSLMKGIGKYDSIYGIDLRKELSLPDDTLFMHDVEAYARGVWEAHPYPGKTMVIAIGTGCGSAFMDGGRVLKEGEGVPRNGWLYVTPFLESIIDDYVSARGQDRCSAEVLGKVVDGAELDRMAGEGDEGALSVFRLFGRRLKEALTPFVESFQPGRIVFGGQISKSFRFFGEDFASSCGAEVLVEPDTSRFVFLGLAGAIKGGLS